MNFTQTPRPRAAGQGNQRSAKKFNRNSRLNKKPVLEGVSDHTRSFRLIHLGTPSSKTTKTEDGHSPNPRKHFSMKKEQLQQCLDDLLRSFAAYEHEEGLPPAPDGRHHLDINHTNYLALLTALRWAEQNIHDFEPKGYCVMCGTPLSISDNGKVERMRAERNS